MTTLIPTATARVFQYEFSDVLRSRWVTLYALFFFGLTEGLFQFGGTGTGVLLSLLNVVLILIPLVGVVFGALYLYQAREFVELMLAQPVRRGELFAGLYAGLSLPLAGGFVLGVGVPFLLHGGGGTTLAMLLAVGVLLTLVFVALAFWLAVRFEDRVRGLAVAVGLWLAGAVLYDGLVLALVAALSAYPLERPMIALTLLNPIDLGRVLLLLHFDVSALMGYTGAVFERFFGSALGTGVSLAALGLWLVVPLGLGLHRFRRKDF
ncbi:MAG: hypothetical protein D6685_16880 [Bacteroidetes bacterium]|nr:MAG: hypothetical protein D6685_16880 [Bacteroidota bacterium]